MSVVIDASIALTWCFEDERTPASDAIGKRVLLEGAIVPQLFHIELANVLLVGERRKRLTAAEADARLARIEVMPIDIDLETTERAWDITLRLAREENLTVYDATYLELALRLGAELATRDNALRAAASRHGLTVIPRSPPLSP